MPFAAWLFAIVIPLAKKILTGLGIGIISYVGLQALFGVIQANVNSSIGSVTGDFYNIAALYGAFDSISIILSAISIKLSMTPLKKFGILP